MNNSERACISHWFPKIHAAGLPVPRTTIVKTGVNFISIFDGERPDGFDRFIEGLKNVAERHGYPVFLRTGQTSAKHDWKNTCFVQDASEIERHVVNIVEFSELADLRGLDTSVWAVREMLKTEPAFYAFEGFPVTKERRYFVDFGFVRCHHPYWPGYAIEGYSQDPDWQDKLATINIEDEKEVEELSLMAAQAGVAVGGKWSVDFLWTTNLGWVLTDMAPAEMSYHWPDCPAEATRAG